MHSMKLTKIIRERTPEVDPHNDTDEPGENNQQRMPEVITTPVMINIDAVRCFNNRRSDRPGTRLTFTDGGGFAVTESFDEVVALINDWTKDIARRLDAHAAANTESAPAPAAPSDVESSPAARTRNGRRNS